MGTVGFEATERYVANVVGKHAIVFHSGDFDNFAGDVDVEVFVDPRSPDDHFGHGARLATEVLADEGDVFALHANAIDGDEAVARAETYFVRWGAAVYLLDLHKVGIGSELNYGTNATILATDLELIVFLILLGDVGGVGRVGVAERRTAAAPPLGTRPQWSVEKGRERYCVGMLSWGWAKMPRASKAV